MSDLTAECAAYKAVTDWIDAQPSRGLIGCTPSMVAGVAINAYRDALAAGADDDGWGVWAVWDYDNGPQLRALFPDEISAHRFVQRNGYFARVTRFTPGEFADQARAQA
ncbi:hypothetical protein [Mycobacterium asiaticum]|uniref:Uncharacterized protein n=1 Tax=Mycobacterium asiaticum TaxID=1790 RepID=A0A1A3NK76_MYCAS|nr:hypothetical protein [Mycobacterium asiaticum]OBK22543.1 hypothetical protein A5635_21750 [Mycobacterium asiaticum]